MQACTNLPTVDLHQLVVGQVLGVGGFSSVCSVCIRPAEEDENGSGDTPNRSLLWKTMNESNKSTSCTTISTTDSSTLSSSNDTEDDQDHVVALADKPYAMKRLHQETLSCPIHTRIGLDDLHNEVRILSGLPYHPNIVQIQSISRNFWDQSPETAFFLEEQLVETLADRLQRWKLTQACSVRRPFLWRRRRRFGDVAGTLSSASLELERVQQVVLGIVDAMLFLHQHCILFRDLKPSNVGLDRHGTVRLVDFGLATPLHDHDGVCTSGKAGTLRYMAPEVAQAHSSIYTFSADVYSFGILLWHVCALDKPYQDRVSKVKAHQRLLCLKQCVKSDVITPTLKHVASDELRALLQECWNPVPQLRPTFASIRPRLDHVIINHTNKCP